MKGGYSRKSVLTGITSFLIVLFTMPLGHALMIFMEYVLSSTALHYAAFTMGAVGLVMVIIGVFAKGDTRQTLWGADATSLPIFKKSFSVRVPPRL